MSTEEAIIERNLQRPQSSCDIVRLPLLGPNLNITSEA